jgi:hypothetical protein
MHSVLFHLSAASRLYEVQNLRIKDILSICNPLVQIRITYDLIQLSAYPVTEADVRFTWEQVSGTTVLDINDTDSAEPFILLDGAIIDDVVFKLYIDKGSEYEQSVEMTIYRTPTSVAVTNTIGLLSMGTGNQSLAVNGTSYASKAAIRHLKHTKVAVWPRIDLLSNSTVYTELNLPDYSVVVDYPSIYTMSGHRVIGLQALHPITGVVIASTTHDTIINIPVTTTVFYLNMVVELNYYNDAIQTETVNLSDNNVHSTYYKQYLREQSNKALYITEGVSTEQNIALSTSKGSDVALAVSLPVIKTYTEEAATSGLALPSTSLLVTTKLQFQPVSKLVEELGSVVTLIVVQKIQEPDKVLTRFNGISIGG